MTADTIGGVWTYALELARALQPHGVAVTIATMGRLLREEQRRRVALLENVQLFESDFALEWMAEPWDEVDAAGDWLLHLEALVQPDIVHLNGYVHASLPWKSPVLVVGHSCVSSWFHAVHGTEPPPEWAEYRQRVAGGLRAAGGVTAPTLSMLTNLRRHYGDFVSLAPIANGRNGRFRPQHKEPFIVSAGRLWDQAKNLEALSRVAPDLPWEIRAAGPCDHPVSGKAVLAGIHAVGFVGEEELANLYGRAAIFALPSRYEPFGLAALEAALSGCALVLGDIESLREVWGDAAVYVHPDDHAGLRDGLMRLIQSPQQLVKCQRDARERAGTYVPRRMAECYLQAYQDLVSPTAALQSKPEDVKTG